MQIDFAQGHRPDRGARTVEFMAQADNEWVFCVVSYETLAQCFDCADTDRLRSPDEAIAAQEAEQLCKLAERAFKNNRPALEAAARSLIESRPLGASQPVIIDAGMISPLLSAAE